MQDMQHILTQNMDPQKAIDARIAMEPGAAILAAHSAQPRDWELLKRLFGVLKQAVQDKDALRYRKADSAFHKTILRITRNDVLIAALLPVLDSVRQPLWRMMKEGVYDEAMLRQGLEEHKLIYEAIRSGDDYFIFRAIRTHLTRSKARLMSEQAANEESARQAG